MRTIADGIAVRIPGKLTFEISSRYLDDIISVTDDEISGACRSGDVGEGETG